jgi:hypothetical protein
MNPRTSRARSRTVLLALALGACGQYADLAQKLDVTGRIAGDTWIAAGGPDRAQIRLLVVGKADANGSAPFAFSAIDNVSNGSTLVSRVTTLQGTWSEVETAGGTGGAATLHVAHTYTLPEEIGTNIFARRGTQRDDSESTRRITVSRGAGRLVVTGDDGLAGTYVALVAALRQLGTTTARDATCAFWIADLGIQTSEGRIIGFNSPGMYQYRQAETYVGTIAGSVRVSLSGTLNTTTRIEYAGFEDVGGVILSGPQVTDADSGGSGHMSGVLHFTFVPLALDPSGAGTITGTIDYGSGADTVQISGGNPSGGAYVASIDGGATARVTPVTLPSPTVAECLALP